MFSINNFFNVHLASHRGFLNDIGDVCFQPIRYFFHGKNVYNENGRIHKVASFHNSPGHRSRRITYLDQKNGNFSSKYSSREKTWLATVGAILTLVPGFFLGSIFKGVAFLSPSLRYNYRTATEQLKPKNFEIGDQNERLNQDEINQKLEELINRNIHSKVNSLIIYGIRGVRISDIDPRIRALNPKKIILLGAEGINHDALMLGAYGVPPVQRVGSVEEALQHKPKKDGRKPYKMMYEIHP